MTGAQGSCQTYIIEDGARAVRMESHLDRMYFSLKVSTSNNLQNSQGAHSQYWGLDQSKITSF